MACVILVPQPGNELGPWVMRMWSSNHWTYKEFPLVVLFALSVYVCGNVLSNYFALKWLEIFSVCVLMPQLNVQMYFFSFDMGDLFLNNFVLYVCMWNIHMVFLPTFFASLLKSPAEKWLNRSKWGRQPSLEVPQQRSGFLQDYRPRTSLVVQCLKICLAMQGT